MQSEPDLLAGGLDLSIVEVAGCAAEPGGRVSVTAPKPPKSAGGGGSHGNSWKQQCRDLHRLLQQLRANHPGPLVVIWDNGPAHRGAAIRSYLTTPDLHLRLVALPAYSPDFNADEAVWDWAREEVTANECHGTKAKVQEKMNQFFGGLILS